ncbi:MAG: hypothetical protein MZV65_15895 [Chromatiales bacterium]|nr:hypothetical protein [Chromatiales bacterium]
MFQRGELSAADLACRPGQGPGRQSKWAQYVYSDPPSADRFSVTYWFVQNFTSSNPEFKAFVNNLNFRKALYYGIDRVKLNELDDPYKPGQIIRNTVVPECTDLRREGRGLHGLSRSQGDQGRGQLLQQGARPGTTSRRPWPSSRTARGPSRA